MTSVLQPVEDMEVHDHSKHIIQYDRLIKFKKCHHVIKKLNLLNACMAIEVLYDSVHFLQLHPAFSSQHIQPSLELTTPNYKNIYLNCQLILYNYYILLLHPIRSLQSDRVR